jgi:hypothetical protein
MQGLTGAFRFEIDEVGTPIPWDELDATVKEKLAADQVDESTSKVYRFKVTTTKSEIKKQRKDVWENVRRVFVEAKPVTEKVQIAGVYPQSEVAVDAHTDTLVPAGTVINQRLFTQMKFKLDAGEYAKRYSRRDRNSVIAAQTKTCAQWVFSDGWDKNEFELFVYAVVPTDLAENKRYLEVNIKPATTGSEVLNSLCVWKHKVLCN